MSDLTRAFGDKVARSVAEVVDDLPLRMICNEQVIPDYGPIITVGVGVIPGARELPPKHALQAAELLVDHALTLDRRLERPILRQPLAGLLDRLFRAIDWHLPNLLKHDDCENLRWVIDREVKARVAEELVTLRDAARKRGLADAAAVVRRLVEIVGEPDDRVRAVAMAGIQSEIGHVMQDMDPEWRITR